MFGKVHYGLKYPTLRNANRIDPEKNERIPENSGLSKRGNHSDVKKVGVTVFKNLPGLRRGLVAQRYAANCQVTGFQIQTTRSRSCASLHKLDPAVPG